MIDDRDPVWQVPLPTEDVLEEAAPEGVLEPQGQIAGFLYFQKLDNDLKQVTFPADPVNTQTEDAFGEMSIPFVVK